MFKSILLCGILYSLAFSGIIEIMPSAIYDFSGYYDLGFSAELKAYPFGNYNNNFLLGAGYAFLPGKWKGYCIMNDLKIFRLMMSPRFSLMNNFYLNIPEIFIDITSYEYTPVQFGVICALSNNILYNKFVLNPEIGIGYKHVNEYVSGIFFKAGLGFGLKIK